VGHRGLLAADRIPWRFENVVSEALVEQEKIKDLHRLTAKLNDTPRESDQYDKLGKELTEALQMNTFFQVKMELAESRKFIVPRKSPTPRRMSCNQVSPFSMEMFSGEGSRFFPVPSAPVSPHGRSTVVPLNTAESRRPSAIKSASRGGVDVNDEIEKSDEPRVIPAESKTTYQEEDPPRRRGGGGLDDIETHHLQQRVDMFWTKANLSESEEVDSNVVRQRRSGWQDDMTATTAPPDGD
jgi:hypothetical protein